MIVVLVDPRCPSVVPVAAAPLLGGAVDCTEEIAELAVAALPDARLVNSAATAPVLLSSDRDHPEVLARLAAGADLIVTPPPPRGQRLVDAVDLMDRLRRDGPWEGQQTHDSLRRYLLEETYELLDAVRLGDPGQVRAELGDLLLQVLFHARIAQEDAEAPFDIDGVADALIAKLTHRAPDVLAGRPVSADEQLAQWEQRKAIERRRSGLLDGVDTGQPALALARQVLTRAARAGIPADLFPPQLTTISIIDERDPENSLRDAVLDFADSVGAAEAAVVAAGPVPGAVSAPPFSAEQWRAHWPRGAARNPDGGV